MSTQRFQSKGSPRSARTGQAGDGPAKAAVRGDGRGSGLLRDGPRAKRILREPGVARGLGRHAAGLARSDALRIALACLAVFAAALASALAFGSRGATIYGARADILYVSDPSTPLDVRERTLATQRELIRSRAVLAPVAVRSRMTLRDLQRATSVEAGARNDLLHITVGDVSVVRARELSAAVTSGYFALSRMLAVGVEQERRGLEREMRRLTARATRASVPEATIIGHRVARLQDRALELDAAGATGSRPRLLSSAYALADPLSPKPVRAVAVGLIIGLTLATGVGIVLARRAGRWTGH